MPDIQEFPDDVVSVASTAEDDHQVEQLLAGFRACAKEAIRFLLEEEGLAPDHALPTGLQEHLDRQQCHLAGMLQNDSGLDIDESFCNSSADDASFITSETSEVVRDTQTSISNDHNMTNASIDSLISDTSYDAKDSND